MSNFTQNSQPSPGKPKRGLSLSIQKRRGKLNNQNGEESKIFKDISFLKQNNYLRSSGRRNRINFVQGYQKNKTLSKYSKQKIFKIVDEDIQLGGKKKQSSFNKTFSLNNTTCILNKDSNISNIKFENRQYFQRSIQSQRQILRESKVINVRQNINYFQKINFDKDKAIQFPNYHQKLVYLVKDSVHKNNKPIQRKLNVIENKENKEYRENLIHMNKQVINESKNPIKIQLSNTQNKLNNTSQTSLTAKTVQKIKQIESQLDKLLEKAYQTRSLILKS